MPRASGRRFLSAEMTSSPLPSPSRMSTTAKAGDTFSTWVRPSATVSAVVTVNPRPSMARARRWRNDLSSSTISKERSPWGLAGSVMGLPLSACAMHGPYYRPMVSRSRAAANRPSRPTVVEARGLEFTIWRSGPASGRRSDQQPLEIGPAPAYPHDRAALRKLAVFQGQCRAGALQQGLGDEKAEAQPGRLVRGPYPLPPAGDEGLAQAVHDLGRKARAVVIDGDRHLVAAPFGRDLDALAREIDGVLHQIAEPIHDRRIARHHRLLARAGGRHDVDGDAEMAMRGDDFLDQGGQAHPLEGLARTGQLGELAQDVAATLHLLAQQPDVLDMRRVVAERLFQLARHQRDGGQRRSEFVRGRGREPVELGEMLLAREHDLGRRQRLGELARFLDDLPRIDADIADAQQDGEPDPDNVGLRQVERIVARPRQRIRHENQD